MFGLLKQSANGYISSIRLFSKNAVQFEKEVTPSNPTPESQSGKLSGRTHKVNNMEKRFLVWTGKFKTVDEIPSYLSPETVEKARSRIRIRVANLMMLSVVFACIGVVISGKRAAQRGESVQKANLEWHRQVKEEDAKQKAASG